MRRAAGIAAALCAVLLVASPAAAAHVPGPRLLFRLADPRITEASGIAAGIASPGVFYVENDSGDTNRFFALNRHTGATVAVLTLASARNVDWEDIAVAPDTAGTPSVWLADIGDNDANRAEVQVYRVREPKLSAQEHDRTLKLRVAGTWRLRYPDGPVDAESLAVAPDGTAYIATKSPASSTVYRLPPRPDAHRVQPLRPIGDVGFLPTGTANPFGLAGELVATSAAFARDGSAFAIRTYSDAYVWHVGASGLAAALRHPPRRIALPQQPQGEGIAIVDGHLLIDSEQRGSAVYSVPFPSKVDTRPTNPVSPPSVRSMSPPAVATPGSSDSVGVVVGALAGVVVLAAVIGLVWHARRRDELGRRGP